MLPKIVQLSIPSPLSYLSTSISENPDSHSSMADRTNCTNRANRANCATYTDSNVRLYIDSVTLELEASVSEAFLRTLIRAVHYA